MAGIMDEYDPPTPLSKSYCARLNNEEYENQASQCTEEALLQLFQHLERTPESYGRILRKRKQETEENAGLLSFIKVRLTSLFYDQYEVPDEECEKELTKMKSDMMKVFDYSQESKGRRYSKRLAERRMKERSNHSLSSSASLPPAHLGPSDTAMPPPPPPPPPPLPPLPPPECSNGLETTPQADTVLTRRPLTSCSKKYPEIKKKRTQVNQPSNFSLQEVMQELKKCPGKKHLRSRIEKSPGGTPVTGWPRSTCDSNVGYFNTKLVEKFRSIRSPVNTPSPLAYSAASPGAFDSPVLSEPSNPPTESSSPTAQSSS